MSNDKPRQDPANEAYEKRAREVLLATVDDVPPEVAERLVSMRRDCVKQLY